MAFWTVPVDRPVRSPNLRIPGQHSPVLKSAWDLMAIQIAKAFTPMNAAMPDIQGAKRAMVKGCNGIYPPKPLPISA